MVFSPVFIVHQNECLFACISCCAFDVETASFLFVDLSSQHQTLS
jgi:predicted metal-binding protein